MFITNTKEFLAIIWPVLFEWANIHSYILPDESYMDSIIVKRANNIPCSIPNSITTGRCANTEIQILFPTRSKKQKMLTLIHEYAHVIQRHNYKVHYDIKYESETNSYGYNQNIFEIEARFISSLLELEFDTNSKIAKQLKKFNWLLTKTERYYSSWTLPKATGKHWQPHHWHNKFQGLYN